MAMNMDQMQMMMAQMHRQNYNYDQQLARHFQEISNIYTNMARSEYQAFQMHQNQPQGSAATPPSQPTFMPYYE